MVENVALTSTVRVESWRVVSLAQCICGRVLRTVVVEDSTRFEKEYDEGRSCCRSCLGAPIVYDVLTSTSSGSKF